MQLTNQQTVTINKLAQWVKHPDEAFITVGGYAGTGKTTIIAKLRQQLHKDTKALIVAFCAYTGKATRVLQRKLSDAKSIYPNDNVGTIHSLIYSPISIDGKLTGWQKQKDLKADLIIIDEASMIDYQIWKDLLSFKKPIIAVGDHGQLPPINNNFSLMQNPRLQLTQIHRQAANSPIIQLSIMARESGEIAIGKYSNKVIKFDRRDSETSEYFNSLLESTARADTLLLCGYNNTRNKLNDNVRRMLEIDNKSFVQGDKVICLKNNHRKQIYNGLIGYIEQIEANDEQSLFAKINLENGQQYAGNILRPELLKEDTYKDFNLSQKFDFFDFGYAITVHKAQGSQCHRVIVLEEKFKQMDDATWKRWLYTAVTRAEEELYIF